MTFFRRVSFTALTLMLCAGTLRAEEADLPSPAAIQKLVDDQQYSAALRLLQRVLSLTGPSAAAYDRYDMLMLRAECQIQLRAQTPALEALALAKKDAFTHAKLDRAADPIALAFLLQRSKMFQYTPVAVNTGKPISVLDRSQRGPAFLALLTDEFPVVAKRVSVISAVKTVPPLLEIARSAGTLRAVEYAATRDDKQTAPLTRAVAIRVEELLDAALLDSSTRVASIAHAAQNIVTELAPQYSGGNHTPTLGTSTHRHGISGGDGQYLLNVQATCGKVSAAADEMEQGLDGQDEILAAIRVKADTLKQQIHDLLSDNYAVIPPPPAQ